LGDRAVGADYNIVPTLGDEQGDLGAGLRSLEEKLRAVDSLPRLRDHFFDDQALEGATAVVPALA